jgi:hypothetical protein
MIASGGLSGGLSSSIAGGSFWKGVREGLITSGLNHAMNHVVNNLQNKKSLSQRFAKDANGKYIINPDGKATHDAKGTASLLENVEGLKDAYNWSGGNKKIDYNLTKEEGLTITEPGKEGFSFNKRELTSNWKVASAMFHEFRHGLQYWGQSQLFTNWYKKFNDMDITLWYMELDAYRYELNMGSPSSSAIQGYHKYYNLIKQYERHK